MACPECRIKIFAVGHSLHIEGLGPEAKILNGEISSRGLMPSRGQQIMTDNSSNFPSLEVVFQKTTNVFPRVELPAQQRNLYQKICLLMKLIGRDISTFDEMHPILS